MRPRNIHWFAQLAISVLVLLVAAPAHAEEVCDKALSKVMPAIHAVFRAYFPLRDKTESFKVCPADVVNLRKGYEEMLRLNDIAVKLQKDIEPACGMPWSQIQDVTGGEKDTTKLIRDFIANCEAKK